MSDHGHRLERHDGCIRCFQEEAAYFRYLAEDRAEQIKELRRGAPTMETLNAQAKTIGELQDSLKVLEEENRFLERDNAQLTELVNKLDEAVEELKNETIAPLQVRGHELDMALEDYRKAILQQETTIMAQRLEIDNKDDDIRTLETELRAQTDDGFNSLQNCNARQVKMINDLESSLKSARKGKNALQSMNDNQRDMLRVVQDELNAKTVRLLQLETSITVAANGLKGLVDK